MGNGKQPKSQIQYKLWSIKELRYTYKHVAYAVISAHRCSPSHKHMPADQSGHLISEQTLPSASPKGDMSKVLRVA